MTYHPQRFIILADTMVGIAKQTRLNRASAMCLADNWAEKRYANIRIIDPDGVEYDRRQFRETLTLVKQVKRRALALT